MLLFSSEGKCVWARMCVASCAGADGNPHSRFRGQNRHSDSSAIIAGYWHCTAKNLVPAMSRIPASAQYFLCFFFLRVSSFCMSLYCATVVLTHVSLFHSSAVWPPVPLACSTCSGFSSLFYCCLLHSEIRGCALCHCGEKRTSFSLVLKAYSAQRCSNATVFTLFNPLLVALRSQEACKATAAQGVSSLTCTKFTAIDHNDNAP